MFPYKYNQASLMTIQFYYLHGYQSCIRSLRFSLLALTHVRTLVYIYAYYATCRLCTSHYHSCIHSQGFWYQLLFCLSHLFISPPSYPMFTDLYPTCNIQIVIQQDHTKPLLSNCLRYISLWSTSTC